MEGEEQQKFDKLDWAVEGWYEAIKEFTFETRFVELPPEAVQALLRAHDARSAQRTLEPAHATVVEQLREQVEEAIEALGGAAFVRISTLSPKDAVKWQSEKLKGLLEAELEGAAAGDEDAEIIAINMACCLACRVTNGAEAMDLLIRSDRVDRHLATRREEEGDELSVNIVIRKWLDFRPELEFRGFVYDRQLTAVTHYYKFCFVREAVEKKEAIAQQIRSFYEEKLRDTIPASTYAIDFALLPDGQLIVVELNPFAPNTSPGLFDWTKDEDVLKGVKPFEFRLLENRVENARELLAAPLRFLLDLVRPREAADEKKGSEEEPAARSRDKKCILS